VSAGSSPYLVDVAAGHARVWYQDIEASRVAIDERWEELGYEPRAYPWFEAPPVEATAPDLVSLRRKLAAAELERYRAAGADAAAALTSVLGELRPELRELDAAGTLAGALHARGFTTPVVLVGGEARAPVHRHPLPTEAKLGAFALLAASVERDGLYVSLTRIVSFGAPPVELDRLVRAAAAVDAAVLEASRPGRTLGELFAVIARAYEEQGFPEEWRRHHQGGLTGYKGREVFARPGDETVVPGACAFAWNPSITGGGKSEDTVLVTGDGVDVITRTPDLPTLPDGRPSVVRL
jgi:Xaa-Pro aminopeptidase